jgi:hypothetical protein
MAIVRGMVLVYLLRGEEKERGLPREMMLQDYFRGVGYYPSSHRLRARTDFCLQLGAVIAVSHTDKTFYGLAD